MGLITLIVFPVIGFFLLWFFEDYTIKGLIGTLELDRVVEVITLIGIELGLLYGFFVVFVSQAPVFEKFASPQMKMLKRLNLNWMDALFISFCAGFGEEILFRVCLQTWFGPWVTTFVFIAIHGYFSIKIIQKNILGILLFPFILLISFGYEEFGFWFSVSAHFAYDFLMFMMVVGESKKMRLQQTS